MNKHEIRLRQLDKEIVKLKKIKERQKEDLQLLFQQQKENGKMYLNYFEHFKIN